MLTILYRLSATVETWRNGGTEVKNANAMVHKISVLPVLILLTGFTCFSSAEVLAETGNTGGSDKPEPCPVEELLPPADTTAEEVEKRILISLADQMMWVFENDEIVQRFLVSTGVPGHRTPTGRYSVCNRSPRAYSRRYECYMLQWMAITRDGLIGMHALEGHRYERLLGHVASHGCIRLSHVNAQWLYEWVEIGTPVEIVSDWEEPAPPPTEEEILAEYPFHW